MLKHADAAAIIKTADNSVVKQMQASEQSFPKLDTLPESGLVSRDSEQSVDAQELVALHALLTDVARNRNITPETLRSMIADRLGFDVRNMRRSDAHKALEFLIDLHFDELRSKK